MKLLRNTFISFLALLASAQFALAECTLNGEEVPCDQLPVWLWSIPVVFGGFGIFCFVFWLLMLIDAIKHQEENKTMWVLLIVFLNFLGALIYYFVSKRKRA